MLRLYGPFFGAGIKVNHISDDFHSIKVSMGLTWYNRNYVGTQFGGSLYSMVDPFYMLMLMNILGRDYIVWDKAAQIEFVSPGRGKVFADFNLSQAQIDQTIAAAEDGKAHFPQFEVEVYDEQKQLVAKVLKTLYVKKKR